jgi:hypothetical protein
VSLCSHFEELVRRGSAHGSGLEPIGELRPAWLLVFDLENAWRAAGEWAIRAEMERRLTAHAARPRPPAVAGPRPRGLAGADHELTHTDPTALPPHQDDENIPAGIPYGSRPPATPGDEN